MIYDKIIEDAIDLKPLIKSNKIEILFDENVPLDEFNLIIKGTSLKISIRNKYYAGSDGKEIQHDPTIKIILNDNFSKDGMLGLPITISDNPKIYNNLDTPYNKKIIKKYMKYIKKFIKDNRLELEEYWIINPNTKQGLIRLHEIENTIRRKYE